MPGINYEYPHHRTAGRLYGCVCCDGDGDGDGGVCVCVCTLYVDEGIPISDGIEWLDLSIPSVRWWNSQWAIELALAIATATSPTRRASLSSSYSKQRTLPSRSVSNNVPSSSIHRWRAFDNVQVPSGSAGASIIAKPEPLFIILRWEHCYLPL